MEQDLFSWLNSQKKTNDTGLLVAPLIPGSEPPLENNAHENQTDSSEPQQQDSFSYAQDYGSDLRQEDSPANVNDESARNFQQHEDLSIYSQNYDSDLRQEDSPAYVNDDSAKNFQQHEDLSIYSQDYDSDSRQEDFPANFNDESAKNFQRNQDSSIYSQDYDSDLRQEDSPVNVNDESVRDFQQEETQYADNDEIPQDHDWQERATGFTLSLDEPPPELWTHINDDDPDPEYEATDSLQGAAYVQIHGRNFTERLHHTLKHRKERAEERAQAENDNPPSKTLRQIAMILCGTLVIVMGFALLSLWFVRRETPDGMKRRAESFIEAGNFDEAAEIYRTAHRRYPDKAEFLAGLSEASEKAGHPQTAKAAREEYHNKTESRDNPPKPEIKPQTLTRRVIPEEKPMTFTDYLNEANYAYNIGMYNRAVIYFSRAMNINSRDIRPYLGLSACYRMKGMYFDSYRIIEEARRIFGRSPAIDMCIYFLREAKQ